LVGRGGPLHRNAVDVVGSFTVDDETSAYWQEGPALVRPTFRMAGDSNLVALTALVAPAAYSDVLGGGAFRAFRYTWHYFVDRDRLQSGRLDGLLADLRRLEGTFPS